MVGSKRFLSGRDPADENSLSVSVARWAGGETERIIKSDCPARSLCELALEYRPDNWHFDKWKHHVYDVLINSYQDRRHIDGFEKDSAVVMAYYDTVCYLALRPDSPHLRGF